MPSIEGVTLSADQVELFAGSSVGIALGILLIAGITREEWVTLCGQAYDAAKGE